MKKAKSLLFLFALIFTCPLFMFGCGEVKFEDIPYTDSTETAADALTKVKNAVSFMDRLELEIEFETTNTYTFYETADGKVKDKVIKEVITTTIGRQNQTATATSPNVFVEKKDKYVDDTPVSSTISTYTTANLSRSYCYYFYQDKKTNGKYEKIRNESDKPFSRTDFFKIIKLAEDKWIDIVQQKTYKDNVHYRLVSDTTGRTAVNDKFVEDPNGDFLENPNLGEVMSKSKLDAVVKYTYEFSVNKGNYLDYVRINYDIETNSIGEKYLSVVSETKLVQYGESVRVGLPSDSGEFIANSFKKNMGEEKNIITYTVDNKAVSVTKVGNEYLVEEEDTTTTPRTINKYVIKYENNKHTAYSVAENQSGGGTLTECDYELDLLNYDFSLSFYGTEKNGYQYGTNSSYIIITVENLEVKSMNSYKAGKEGNLLTNIKISEATTNDTSKLETAKNYPLASTDETTPEA